MDKNAIKKYAVWARNELISRVSQKALQYGISEKETDYDDVQSINGVVLSSDERNQRRSLIAKIKKDGYSQAMEEASYTWFNRFIALRYMEVNGYIPSRVRVFTDDENAFKPQIIDEAIHLEIDGLDMEKVYEFKEGNKTDELYKYLLITQCNALGKVLPGMFTKISDYTQLLFPDNLLREGSVIEQMISMIPEDDWKDQVQIIGWLYQYYIAEPKDKLINAHKAYQENEIKFVTQIFTSDWIVHYMVENSLGRLWTDGHGKPDDADWKYYLEESEQEHDVQVKLEEIRKEYRNLTPEQITFFDPCMGSGHILVYAFDVFMDIYRAYGYTERESASLIIQKNLYGLDIDERAYQLAYFALMMKARQYDRRFLTRKDDDGNLVVITPNLSNFNEISVNADNLEGELKRFAQQFENADVYGSLLKVEEFDIDSITILIEEFEENLDTIGYKEKLEKMLVIYKTLLHKYDVCCTNPPYMNSTYMPNILKSFIQSNYVDYKSDLFAVFISKCISFTKTNGQIGLLTPYVWMFISSYESLRNLIYNQTSITSMVQLEYNAFEGACVPVGAFTLRKSDVVSTGEYIKLSEFKGIEVQDPKTLEAVQNKKCGYRYTAKQENFSKIPGSPVAYWVSQKVFDNFEKGKNLGCFAYPKQGLATADNNRFLKLWYEVNFSSIDLDKTDNIIPTLKKWYPHNKGGEYRKWYGNRYYIINWELNGSELKNFKGAVIRNPDYYFKEMISYSDLTSGNYSLRYYGTGFIFDSTGPSIFNPKSYVSTNYLLGVMNSNVINTSFLKILCPTMHYTQSAVAKVPIILTEDNNRVIQVEELVRENVLFSQIDWDSFETSWDFEKHPFINGEKTIEKSFEKWSVECENRFNTLKANEEELNRIFIDIYGLQDELTPEVDDKDVTVRKADLVRDVKSFISYAVGCMFGRYSIDTNGLAYAGGEWDETKYRTFIPDDDNIIPICDDEYFEDDLTGRFVQFVETVYGKDTLEENLKFIADALGTKGQPRDVIRNYFINNFFADHCKTYQKRPIYWLFESGKKNGFKALIYMHRYQPDTIARIRTDYVHEQQARYRTAIEDINQRILSSSTSERVKLTKTLTKLNDQAEEIRVYEEKIHHLADQMIKIDLDDGVKNNYGIFSDVLAKIK
ncbi:MAG: BREX-1 system adenine-specific DNA-methyltransferase PglX [Oscillospiraceae bacterium]|nr:BREX-1 system adenine-specific DNA-methyltransferase PglX [Oscillospiraceae bacterium]